MNAEDILYKAKPAKGYGMGWSFGGVFYDKFQKEAFIITDVEAPDGNLDNGSVSFCPIDQKTICRYSGKTIAEGVRIWEGDLVMVKGKRSVKTYIDLVVIDNYGGLKLKKNRTYFSDSKSLIAVFKVIGNKFDNPEIMESEGLNG